MTFEKMNKSTLVSLIISLFVALPSTGYAIQTNTEDARAGLQDASTTVSGVVRDENGQPLPGVSVIVDGTTTGTLTNIQGEFSITCRPTDVLNVSFLGYEPQRITVGNRSSITVILGEDTQMIDDVIVIGYGTTTRRRATGAVDQVKAEAIADRSVANVTQALQGTSPSLVIQQRNFDPNDNQLNINIRGIGTMNNNEPLVVIDGLVADGTTGLNRLNPADIESISVLKDAGTAAIYGSRAANGVLLVTTKKGRKNQAPVVQVNAMVGFQDPKLLATPVEGYQNATLTNIARMNAGMEAQFTAAEIRDLYDNGNGKWLLDQVLETALQQSYNVSVSGGGQYSTYMISASYFDQASNYVGNNFGIQRYNLRSNLTAEYKRFKVTTLISYARNNSLKPSTTNIINDASRVPTYYYYKLKDEQTGHYLINNILSEMSPLGLMEAGGYEKNRQDYVNFNVGVDFRIIDGLKLKGVLGGDIFTDHRFIRRIAVPFYDYQDPGGDVKSIGNANNESEDYNNQSYLINSQLMLDYDKQFGKHHVYGLVGASNESYTRTQQQIRFRYTDPELGIPTDGSEVADTFVKDNEQSFITPQKTDRRAINSIFGRVGYDYDLKYFAEFSFRYDGSSRFEKKNRWGFFPSVSLGWSPTEEDFMDFWRERVGSLKIRASYGTLGNQNVGDYQFYDTYTLNSNQYGFNNSPVSGLEYKPGSENLKWETTRTFNIGADGTFLNNSLSVSYDFFVRNTKDILIAPIVPGLYGWDAKDTNSGAMRTKGWEVTINYRLRTGDVRHTFDLNVGDSWNKVTKMNEFEQLNKIDEIWRMRRIGLPFNSYYGFKTAGIFESYDEIDKWAKPTSGSYQPGDLKFVDRNGDGTIDNNDLYYLGNAFPRYTFGFTYSVEWKGIDFSMFLQGVLKRDQFLRGELIEPFHSGYGYTMFQHQLDYWTPTNTGAKYPRLAMGNSINYGGDNGSDVYILDAKYMRLKNIAIGYTLPERISKKAGMQKLRIYVNAQNILTFNKNNFFDPESSEFNGNFNNNGGNSGRMYPFIRYYGMGVDITF